MHNINSLPLPFAYCTMLFNVYFHRRPKLEENLTYNKLTYSNFIVCTCTFKVDKKGLHVMRLCVPQ